MHMRKYVSSAARATLALLSTSMAAAMPTRTGGAHIASRVALDLSSLFRRQNGFEHVLARRSKLFRYRPSTSWSPKQRNGAQECARRRRQAQFGNQVLRDARYHMARYGHDSQVLHDAARTGA